MGKLSVELLFPEGKKDNKKIDINTIFNTQETIDTFQSEKLVKERQDELNKTKEAYKQILNTCLEKIKFLNTVDKTDFVYTIPVSYYGHRKYNTVECLKYIEKKLRKKYFDTLIISNLEIFISWENIEENKYIENKIKKESNEMKK